MKRIVCVLVVLGLAMLAGCQPSKPVDAAKSIMDKQITGHKGFDFDTSKLSYKLIEQQGDTAKVAVSGAVQVEAEILLKKEGGKWVLAGKETGARKAAAEMQEKAAEHK